VHAAQRAAVERHLQVEQRRHALRVHPDVRRQPDRIHRNAAQQPVQPHPSHIEPVDAPRLLRDGLHRPVAEQRLADTRRPPPNHTHQNGREHAQHHQTSHEGRAMAAKVESPP